MIHSQMMTRSTSTIPTFHSERRSFGSFRKILAAIVLIVLGMQVGISGFNALFGTDDIHTTQTYTVHAGDTVFSIAESVDKSQTRDVREIEREIEQWNGLHNAVIQPGENLVIPVEVK